MSFDRMWAELAPLGRDRDTGGYRRFAWTREDAALREWFTGEAGGRGLSLTEDRAGNLWAWLGDPDADGPGLVLGSHLDSVPDGGAFDGPLGVVSALAALDRLRAEGWSPRRPVAIAVFADEEGARFGVACAGSRILTGGLDADRARALRDSDGTTMADALAAAGRAPSALGPDAEALRRVGRFVELHVEQGKGLVDARDGTGAAVGVASAIWPHGRWRLDLAGRADHAGTTRLADRADPMLALADAIRTARTSAERHRALATVGKLSVRPNGVNAIPSAVTAWLDARGPVAEDVRAVVADVAAAAGVDPVEESWTPTTDFDPNLRDRLATLLADPDGTPAPVLPTGAGHDAGILAAAGIPSAMLFVRNPTGVSHSPREHAEPDDCHRGVHALARVLRELG
ncbi:allantoate amidohydrolase [Pseudonocardia eucalypti]|uniref:Allantoate amidohydrolase n=1 Tax=Pseudonocardia eucalypti TaxID=648755 RepID=A0ABP9Q442_9PSEU|nr:N-carbamoyl-L-amino-acid hydrolase [Pseudonocardia eucalypti]